MNTMIAAIVLAVYALSLFRFAWYGILWLRVSEQTTSYHLFLRKTPGSVYVSSLLDIIFFRRIFITSKLLWIGSWTFHLSLVFVLLRHLRYFFRSLPDCLILPQPVGVFAGYLLTLSLLYLVILRTVRRKDRYTSAYNYFIVCMLLLISITGVVMRNFFRPDPVAVKYFTLGIFGLHPHGLPGSPAFILHGSMFLVLLPYLPTHMLAAPFVNVEANKRQEELRFIIHEK